MKTGKIRYVSASWYPTHLSKGFNVSRRRGSNTTIHLIFDLLIFDLRSLQMLESGGAPAGRAHSPTREGDQLRAAAGADGPPAEDGPVPDDGGTVGRVKARLR